MAIEKSEVVEDKSAREAALDALWDSFDGLIGQHSAFLAAKGVVTLDPDNDDAYDLVDWDKLILLVCELDEEETHAQVPE